MNDRQLRYAHAVWHERSFSRAAGKIGVSQPSLSEQIRLLEEELGFSLFYRNSRGVEASANGQVFLESAETVVSGLSSLDDLARELRGKPGTTIRVGINAGLAQALVPRFVLVMTRGNIKIRSEVVTATTRRVQRLVHQQRLDLGFVFEGEARPASDRLIHERVGESEIVVLAPPAHPLARRRTSVDLGELARQPLIVNEPRIGYGQRVMGLFAQRGVSPEIVADCDDLELLKWMVNSGAGLALAPRIIAEPEIAQGRLSAISIEPAVTVAIELVRRPDALPPRLERIRLALVRELAEPKAPTPPGKA